MTLPQLPALYAALQNLFDTYPTDDEGAERLTLALESGGERLVVRLQPGQAEWLTNLVKHEEESCRNAHEYGTGVCAHCRGLGMVGGRQPRTWVAWQSDGGGPGTPCTDAATAKWYAETQYLDGLHSEDQEAAVLRWTGTDDLRELEDNGQDTGWCVSPEPMVTADAASTGRQQES